MSTGNNKRKIIIKQNIEQKQNQKEKKRMYFAKRKE